MKYLIGVLALCFGLSTSVAAQGFAALMERIEAVEKRLQQMETSSAAEGVDLVPLQRKLDRVHERVVAAEQLGQRFDKLERQVVQVAGVVEEVERGDSAQGSEVRELAMELSALTGELRRVLAQDLEMPVSALAELPALEISGFGDFCTVRDQHRSAAGRYEIGQVELGLSAAIDPRVGVDVAIAYDGEGFGLGAFTTDFRIAGRGEEYFYTSTAVESMGIIAGQFDVPFGVDWRVYPSIDRLLVSAPLVVEGAHEAWNDYGVQSYVQMRHINAVAYLVNGTGVDEVEMAAGGRIGVQAGDMLELGFSLAGFFADERRRADLLGLDASVQLGALAVKGEYIRRHEQRASAGDSRGFYTQAMWDFGRYFAVGRYDYFSIGDGDDKRFSSGVGWRVIEACQVRFEYQVADTAANAVIGQLVVGF